MDDYEIYYTYPEIEDFIINYKSADAVKLLVSLLKTNKNHVEKLFEKAMIYYYIDSDLNNSLKELNIILNDNPGYMDALLLKGEILAGIHKHNEAIKTFNNIHPKILPYCYKKLIEYITEYNHSGTIYYSLFDLVSHLEYVYIETGMFKKLKGNTLDFLEYKVFEMGLIWQYLEIDSIKSVKESVPIISGIRLSDEEQNTFSTNVENCIICGKKLTTNQKNICRACFKKQYASRIIKKLVSVVQPEVPFRKNDLKSLNLDDIQIQDYIWTLQEFNLIDVDNNKFKLKDKTALNKFRIESKMEPIDFDSLDEKNSLNKRCNICGKTLPISQFYKSVEGYEDVCKICKKLKITARYLEDVIKYVGFDNEFDENDLNEYIPNQSQIMGMIWSLQDNDLIVEKEGKIYVLANKSKCLSFLEKYDANYNFDELSIKSKYNVKIKSKSKVKDVLDKSEDSNALEVVNNNTKFQVSQKLLNYKKKQMNLILKVCKDGKTIKEAAQLNKIPLYKVNHWYDEGKRGFGKDNIAFYKQLKKIENKLLEASKANERKQMNFVLKLMSQGKTIPQIAEFTELNASTITSWYHNGSNGHDENTSYFYNQVHKIKDLDVDYYFLWEYVEPVENNEIDDELKDEEEEFDSKDLPIESFKSNEDLNNNQILDTVTEKKTGGILSKLRKLYEEDKKSKK